MKSVRVLVAVAVSVLSVFYLLPTGIAIGRSRTNTTSIFVVNLLLGWTLIGWVVALAWSVAKDDVKPVASQSLQNQSVPAPQAELTNDDLGKKVLLIIIVSIVIAGIAYQYQDRLTSVLQNQPVQTHVETEQEKQARWDRGDFTQEEIAEIKAEEEREDTAIKNLPE